MRPHRETGSGPDRIVAGKARLRHVLPDRFDAGPAGRPERRIGPPRKIVPGIGLSRREGKHRIGAQGANPSAGNAGAISGTVSSMEAAAALEPATLRDAVVITAELARRPSRPPQHAVENQALLRLTDTLAAAPATILQVLADSVTALCRAGSAGISLREPGAGEPTYFWRGLSGVLAAAGSGRRQPRQLSAWAIALDPGATQLFDRPGRLHGDLDALGPPVCEVLMTPFAVGGEVVGTVWAVHHDADGRFDGEDARLLARLARFAAVAYRLHDSAAVLRAQQTQTNLALEATGIGVFHYDALSGQQVFSARLKALWGLQPEEEPTGARILELIHPEDRGIIPVVKASLDPMGAGRFSVEHRIVRPDGEIRWVESRGHTEFEQLGELRRAVRSVGTMLDVTDRRRAEQQLLEIQRSFTTLVDALPQLAWSSHADGYTDYLSPQWLTYTGFTQERCVGFGWTSALHPDDVPAAVRKWSEVEAVNGSFESELRIRGSDGQYRWFLARATAMKNDAGHVVRWYGTCTDIDLSKTVQEELARREAQLDLATRIAGAGVFDHDYLRRTLYWSERLREIHDLAPGAAPSLDVLDAQIHPDDRAAHLAAVDVSGDPGGSGAFVSEYRIVRRDGGIRWILSRAQTYFGVADGKRRAVRTVGVEQDVTEQKRIEAALRESQQRFVALADSVPVLVWTTRADGHCDYLNERWYEYTGQGLEQALGVGWFDAVHHGDRGPIGRLWERSLRSGEPLEAEYRLRRHDGEYRWFSARATPQRNAAGEIDRWFGTSSDVDEIRRLVIASERAAERLRLATGAAQLGILEYFIDGRRHWDARARVIWGFGPDDDITQERFMSRVHPEDQSMVQASIERVLDPKRSSGRYEAEYRVCDGNGHERWVRATGDVRFRDGKAHHVIGTVQDVSTQKAIEATLRVADRRKDEFLATLAHELRNPLAPIRNAAQILGSPQLDATALHWSRQVIQRQVTHMAWLLDDLLDVARITQGKLELRRERIGLAGVIETAVEAARPLIDGKRHVLAIDLPVPDVGIDADPLRLAQVVSNLLTNAAKYTDAGGRIAVIARVAPPNLVVTVRDTGIGILPTALRSIFEMFSQVADTLSRSEGGLGIGLALVKGLVELHGGSIEARSEGPGRGSEFVVHLPLPIETAAGASEAAAATEPGRRAGRRVLVADDNQDAADSLGMILELAGHEVRVAHGGRQALQIAAEFHPDVVLLDIGMPDLNGYDTARALRAAPGGVNLELIALTGWGHPDDKARAAAAGFDRHLTKPVDPAELEALLLKTEFSASGSTTAG